MLKYTWFSSGWNSMHCNSEKQWMKMIKSDREIFGFITSLAKFSNISFGCVWCVLNFSCAWHVTLVESWVSNCHNWSEQTWNYYCWLVDKIQNVIGFAEIETNGNACTHLRQTHTHPQIRSLFTVQNVRKRTESNPIRYDVMN